MKKTCIVCGKEFEGAGKTCSEECRFIRRRQTQRDFAIKNLWTLYNKICVICGKPFETYKPHEKTCSKECSKQLNLQNILKNKEINKDLINARRRERYQSQKGNAIGKSLSNVSAICEVCEKEFIKQRKNVSYCSEECKKVYTRKYNTEYVRQKRKGEK